MAVSALKIIAHRGASAYLPEHSLAAKVLAYAMGADYLEQDVVASRDGELLVLHDVFLDEVSDVAQRYPQRAREDRRYYCIDFDLEEIRGLRFHERVDPETGHPRFPGRYPPGAGGHRVSTLTEEIRYIQGLNEATGGNVGIYPEIKQPAWHRQQGIDVTEHLLDVLGRFGYLKGNQKIFIQCFDNKELKRLHERVGEVLPSIQLLDSRAQVDRQLLHKIAAYAAGIGPSIKLIYGGRYSDGTAKLSSLVQDAHEAGLVVHPYTFRADDLPPGIERFDDLLELFVNALRVDGVFTDFTDRVAQFLGR